MLGIIILTKTFLFLFYFEYFCAIEKAMLVNEYKVLSESHHKNVIKMEEIY